MSGLVYGESFDDYLKRKGLKTVIWRGEMVHIAKKIKSIKLDEMPVKVKRVNGMWVIES